MTFTVITSLYNQKHYLPKFIDAMANQTFKDFEVIFCDDGSSDGTKEYIEEAKIPFKFKYVANKESKKMKLAQVVNKGVMQSQGDYCLFIMGDSFPELNYLEVMSKFLHPDFVLCGIRTHLDNDKVVDIDWRIKKNMIPDHNAVVIKHPFNALTGNGLVIPAEAFAKYGGWNKKFVGYGGEDTEFLARLYYKGYIMWSIKDAILYHHYHIAQEPNKNRGKMLENLVKNYAGTKKVLSNQM